MIEKHGTPLAERWWRSQITLVLSSEVGLVNAAKGDSKLARSAIAFLKSFKQHEDLIVEYILEVPPQLAQKITKEVLDERESRDLYFSDRNLPEWFKVNLAQSKTMGIGMFAKARYGYGFDANTPCFPKGKIWRVKRYC